MQNLVWALKFNLRSVNMRRQFIFLSVSDSKIILLMYWLFSLVRVRVLQKMMLLGMFISQLNICTTSTYSDFRLVLIVLCIQYLKLNIYFFISCVWKIILLNITLVYIVKGSNKSISTRFPMVSSASDSFTLLLWCAPWDGYTCMTEKWLYITWKSVEAIAFK